MFVCRMCSSLMRANPCYRVTQILKILEAGRHLWRSPRPGCSGLPLVRSRGSPRTETPKLLWQPVPAFYHSQSKKAFFMFNWNFQYFSLYPLPLIFSLSTTGTSLASEFLMRTDISRLIWQIYNSTN